MQIKNLLLATAAVAVLGLAGTQSAKADWYRNGPVPGPAYGHGWYDAGHVWHVYPGYYAPAPRYYVPPPVYYAPRPRYYAPPVYIAPPVVTFGFRP